MAAEDESKEKRVPYYRYAFHNPYNYALLGGVVSASILTQNWWLAVAGLGMEALWMVFGPDSRLLRKLVFDKKHDRILREQAKSERERLLWMLSLEDRERVRSLEETRETILRMCGENRAFTGELLRGELRKLEQLVQGFADLVLATHRYRQYLESVDMNEVERETRRYESLAESAKDPDSRALARKNLAVLTKRREKLSEIHQFVNKASGQIELIENTFRLLGDQIMTMRSPRELSGQLDDLIDGVEAVRTTARETDALMEATTQ